MHYTYDDLGQLIKERPGFGGYIYNYTYDNAGNITKIRVSSTNSVLYPATYVKNFEYSDSAWGDLLVAVNNASIAYDNIGNPTTYYNGFTFTWSGRRLVGATNGTDTYSFTYNADGLRTSKTKNGVTTNYYYSGSLLVKEESSTQTIVYLYDANGSPVGFKYRTPSYAEDAWDEYFYEKNLQGDIVAIYNASGTKLISYTYDAWGNFTTSYRNGGASTTAVNNPYTYRGYYYDSDLELYYLQSRYYDSNTCRFINADGALYDTMLGYNLFVYCNNNPVNYVDYTGKSPFAMLIASNPAVAAATLLLITAFVFLAYDATHDQVIGEAFSDIADSISEAADSMFNRADEKEKEASVEDPPQSLDEDEKKNESEEKRNLPPEGEPNSDQHLYDEDGLKQTRHYGPDGKAEYDIDYRHSGENHTFPHIHYWDWSKAHPRGDGIPIIFP